MRTLLLLPLLLVLVPQGGGDGAPVAVLEFKWTKGRQTVVNTETAASGAPAQAMIPANKNFERNAREQAPAGVRDPNLDTIDGRSAALEKNVQESRAPKTKMVDGFAYRIKVRNAGAKAVEVLFWEYQFVESANPSNVARRQFLCGVPLKPGKEREVLAFSPSGPSGTVSAETLADQSRNSFQEKVVINRVEYSDGSIWQRRDWNFAEVRASVARVTSTPWGQEMCRGL
ncbi:MAG: hypothetical protein M3444_12680 [Acidobacteriota bacterium]|nr:hypothetical protein [Acidobacteriota bacterium]MDQ5835308.1 hypothetical protein [Acidobacteriota bacterium]